jgi:hypothetical protein
MAVLEVPQRKILEGAALHTGLLIQILDRLVASHPTPQGGAGILLVEGGRQVPVEQDPPLVHVHSCAAVGADKENLSLVGMQLTAALGTVQGSIWSGRIHIVDYSRNCRDIPLDKTV